MTDFERFLQWEETDHDTIKVKRMYVDIAGDLAAGILLSQIIYWYLPSKRGTSKLRVMKDGKWWLAKARNDWWDECRLLPDRFDDVSGRLVAKGLIEKRRFRFNGSPTVHVRLVPEVLMEKVNALIQEQSDQHDAVMGEMPISTLAVSPCPYSQNANIHAGEMPKTLTETTAEITTETTTVSPSPPSRRVKIAYSDDFEEFWRLYPRRLGKKAAFGRWMARLNDSETPVTVTQLLAAARNYAAVCKVEGRPANYIMQPETFLGPNERYLDYVDPECVEVAKREARRNRTSNKSGIDNGSYDYIPWAVDPGGYD